MAVFYNDISGQYHTANQSLNPVAEADFLLYESLLHAGIHWHEYSSVQDMENKVAQNKSWPKPTSDVVKGVTNTGERVVNQIPGVHSITDFLSGLTSANLWVRVAKVAIGGVMLIVGLAKMANLQNDVAAKAFKAAPLL